MWVFLLFQPFTFTTIPNTNNYWSSIENTWKVFFQQLKLRELNITPSACIYTNLQQAFMNTFKIIVILVRNLYNPHIHMLHHIGQNIERLQEQIKIFREKMSFTMINKFVPEIILFSILASTHLQV